jgi:hypothetical protein
LWNLWLSEVRNSSLRVFFFSSFPLFPLVCLFFSAIYTHTSSN